MLLVVTGPPGAGKSTVSDLLVQRFEPSALVEGDRFFAFLRSGRLDPWLPESHVQNTAVIGAAAAAPRRPARDGIAVVFDGVVGPWFAREFLWASGLDELDYVVLMPSLEDCLDRVVARSGHGFTDLDAAHHMWDQFAGAGAGVGPGHVLRVSGGEPEALVEEILAARGEGALRLS